MQSIPELQQIIERGRRAAEERKRQEELDAIARQQEEATRHQDRLRKSGLPEWMLEYLSASFYQDNWRYTLALPGCSPVMFTAFRYNDGIYRYNNIGVRVPIELSYDDEFSEQWRASYSCEHLPQTDDSLDEAIALAASYGDAWHAMQAEADRRNAEGLRPEPKPTPAPAQPQSDVIENAAEPLNRLAASTASTETEQTVVLASAILAVAVEVRRLTNALLDEDGDNADMPDNEGIAETIRTTPEDEDELSIGG